jgi:mono/diheme cytochrome c family protein
MVLATKRLRLVGLALLFAAVGGAANAQNLSDESALRAGRNIAVTACVACHVVSPNQAAKPVLGPGIPSFEEIANRPDTTAESLRDAMKVARWHEPGIAATLLPMSRISDTDRAHVAQYILSLRTAH